jgi:hypothetical protein
MSLKDSLEQCAVDNQIWEWTQHSFMTGRMHGAAWPHDLDSTNNIGLTKETTVEA